MTQQPVYPNRLDEQSFRELTRLLSQKDLSAPRYPASKDWTLTNYTNTKTGDASTATLTDVANILWTLINNLKSAGYLG